MRNLARFTLSWVLSFRNLPPVPRWGPSFGTLCPIPAPASWDGEGPRPVGRGPLGRSLVRLDGIAPQSAGGMPGPVGSGRSGPRGLSTSWGAASGLLLLRPGSGWAGPQDLQTGGPAPVGAAPPALRLCRCRGFPHLPGGRLFPVRAATLGASLGLPLRPEPQGLLGLAARAWSGSAGPAFLGSRPPSRSRLIRRSSGRVVRRL